MADADLVPFVGRFRESRVGVLGDLMLDRYIWGSATRISQEAPVPVVRVRRESASPGGAANVVRNLASLGAWTATFGVIGADRHGETLAGILREAGASLDGVVVTPDRETTVKTRVIAGSQQVVRIDREQTGELPDACRQELLARIRAAVQSRAIDALIIEDYAKGVLDRALVEQVVEICRQGRIFVTLDPHPANPFNLHGLRLMTPNRAEAFALAAMHEQPTVLPLASDEALLRVGQRLTELWGPELLLVTLGADGMALFAAGKPLLHIPTEARQVFDVSGAGDTVMAVFVLGLLAGATPAEAARLSNHAAGIVVGRVGTAAVTPAELESALRGECGGASAGPLIPGV
ncbi:MAG: carbohydrate kinase [Lentisphaerae bacterium]|nr:carbohydrate kinase [Lentisphaerota bacterium]